MFSWWRACSILCGPERNHCHYPYTQCIQDWRTAHDQSPWRSCSTVACRQPSTLAAQHLESSNIKQPRSGANWLCLLHGSTAIKPSNFFQLLQSFDACHCVFSSFQVRDFITEAVDLCQPARVHICDGSEEENESIMQLLSGQRMVKPLTKYENK